MKSLTGIQNTTVKTVINNPSKAIANISKTAGSK